MSRLTVATLAVLASALLSGCATPRIQSDVAVFHQMTATVGSDATFAILPWRKENEDSLEFASYAQLVATYLRGKGLTVVEQGRPARYAVFFDYGVDDGRTETYSYVIPTWGRTGYSGSTTYGSVTTYGNTATFNATTTASPTYGVTGYVPATGSYTVFRRFVRVDVIDLADTAGKPKKVYEGRLKSEGSCGNLSVLMPAFAEVLFGEFPGQSGRSGRVMSPWNGKC
jgi:hypothetical protein